MTWSEFRQLISQHFNTEEIEVLCWDMDIEYENLLGETKDRKVADLIETVRKQHRIPELVAALNKKRPPIHWEDILPEWEEDKQEYFPNKVAFASGRNVETHVIKQSTWLYIAGSVLILLLVGVFASMFFMQQDEPEMPQAVVILPTDTAVPTLTATSELETAVTPAQPTKTLTPTQTPTPTVPPTGTPLPVAPVAENEYMVLIVQPEHLSGPERDVARFIVDDLQQQLEVTLPDSKIQVREFPDVITSEKEVLELANAIGADIVIWGKYDEKSVQLDLQVGSLTHFPDSSFSQEDIARMVDVRINLLDERQETLAIPIMLTLANMSVAASDTPEMSRLLTMIDFLPQTPLDIIGNSIAAHYHRSVFHFMDNPEQALPDLNAALLLEQNPLLYMNRGIVYAKVGDIHSAINDWQSAAKLAPDGWFMPQSGISFGASMAGDIQTALTNASVVIQAQPDSWYGYYLQGVGYYLAGEYAFSADAFQMAIERDPTLNWPYTFAIMAALRQGNVDEAKTLAETILKEFPDPTLGNRILLFVFGEGLVVGPTIGAAGSMVLGQYRDVLRDVEKVLAIDDSLADLYFMQGVAYCNLRDYAAAEISYSNAIELDPNYMMLYLLRAEANQHQGNNEAAMSDIQTVMNSPDAMVFANLLFEAKSGKLSCETFLTN